MQRHIMGWDSTQFDPAIDMARTVCQCKKFAFCLDGFTIDFRTAMGRGLRRQRTIPAAVRMRRSLIAVEIVGNVLIADRPPGRCVKAPAATA